MSIVFFDSQTICPRATLREEQQVQKLSVTTSLRIQNELFLTPNCLKHIAIPFTIKSQLCISFVALVLKNKQEGSIMIHWMIHVNGLDMFLKRLSENQIIL
jgi:hypothetical protein